jgi:hypothetical protein
MVKLQKYRSKSVGCAENPNPPREKKHKHLQQGQLLNDEDKAALQLNKFEQAMTLAELQDKIKRQSEMYKKEFKTHFVIFQEKLKEFKLNPAKRDVTIMDYLKFMAHISAVYKQQLPGFLSNEILNLL